MIFFLLSSNVSFIVFLSKIRASILVEQREANQKGMLRLNTTLDGVGKLYGAVQRIERSLRHPHSSSSAATPFLDSDEQAIEDFTNNMHIYAVAAATTPQSTLETMRRCAQAEMCWNAAILSQPVFRTSTKMALRQESYSDWQWPFLLQR